MCIYVPLTHFSYPFFSETADAILEFVTGLKGSNTASSENTNDNNDTTNKILAGGLGFAGISAIAATFAADWLPSF